MGNYSVMVEMYGVTISTYQAYIYICIYLDTYPSIQKIQVLARAWSVGVTKYLISDICLWVLCQSASDHQRKALITAHKDLFRRFPR